MPTPLKVHVNEVTPVLIELEVTVPWEDFGARLDNLYARVGRDAKIRGFRKGKVPRKVLERYFGDSVTREALSEVIERRLMEAVRQSGRRAVATRNVTPAPIEAGQPLKFTAKVEVLAEVGEIATAGLVAERAKVDVADADVDGEIERLRQQQAELAPIDPPRPAKKGDIVTVDYEAFVEGAAAATSKAEGRQVELGSPDLLPGFEAAIVGASEGDERTAEVVFPEDHGRADLRGKSARFVIKVRDLREKVLPDVDDELARDLGEHDTLAALKASIREKLTKARRVASERGLERTLLDDLATKNPVPVPAALVEAQVDGMEQEVLRMVMPEGPERERKMRLSDEIRGQLREQAERRVRAGLLVSELARRDGVEVSDADLDAEIDRIADEGGRSRAKVRAEYGRSDRRDHLRSELIEKRVVQSLLANAEIREVEEAPHISSGGDEDEDEDDHGHAHGHAHHPHDHDHDD